MSFYINRIYGTDGQLDAKDVPVAPSGTIVSTDVDGALKELDQRTAATGAKLYVQIDAPLDSASLWIDTSS